MFVDRKASFKLPPTTIRDRLISQETRRAKALEEQKRKRAQRFDSNRQLDLFADLSLGQSDDDEEDGEEVGDGVVDPTSFTPGSVAAYAPMVEPYQPPNAISGTLKQSKIAEDSEVSSAATRGTNKKRKKKKSKSKKASKYADKCMYAELLEMSEDNPWSDVDGLPENLETAWVAVGPVPMGKRCLAVTHQSSGVAGIGELRIVTDSYVPELVFVVPNTTLRSRLLGKTLIPRFPSILPPSTVLDCILDVNWRENGILHILDVVKWKGQDICDCEATLRYVWFLFGNVCYSDYVTQASGGGDTRLGELGQSQILPASYTKTRTDIYQFPYPTRLIPIPYYTDMALPVLYQHIIPNVKAPRSLTIDLPISPQRPFQAPSFTQSGVQRQEDGMDIESPPFTFGTAQDTHQVDATIHSDGLLLYVAEASYESGTSPLSSWIPVVSYEENDQGESLQPHGEAKPNPEHKQVSGPLAVFERLVWQSDYLSNVLMVYPTQIGLPSATEEWHSEIYGELGRRIYTSH
ncbi:hypothetical protein NP233_g3858 [Leucocoprinus birnbaumii]|uniref:Snurportin-1 n=1 Tax=Leucocoprinus birnbaumii TaxID=56174 RepID=A0AAD5VVU1_9AGAR|nr:hypothetical protein NP233_g3858 [Leucocoprinus birnbaumii]